jgi:hypothetical protein
MRGVSNGKAKRELNFQPRPLEWIRPGRRMGPGDARPLDHRIPRARICDPGDGLRADGEERWSWYTSERPVVD